MFFRLALVNASAIILLILAYNFKNFLQIFISSNNIIIAILCVIFAIILFTYFYLSYQILFKKIPTTRIPFDGKKIESIPKYIQLLTDYLNDNTYTFKRDLLGIIKSCEKFITKRGLVFSTLESHFNKNELSFIKFTNVINGVENSFAVTVNNILLRLNAFDEGEYEDIFRKKKTTDKNHEKRQKIFDEYVDFLKTSSEFLDEILIKMDQLQLEISKLSDLDYHDIENNELIKEIDTLVKTMKLYKIR
jgi:hypothetical protein